MPVLSRSELAAYAVCAALIALVGWRALRSDGAPDAAAAAAAPARSPAPDAGASSATVRRAGAAPAVVHVVGAVQRPGVYRLSTDQRVEDAIRRAGGAASRADLQAVNLAAKLVDAQQVVVPRRGPAVTASVGGTPASAASGASSPGGPAGAPVNLNSATAEQLDTLDGVGPATAQKILDYRTQHGGFRSVDDLAEVPGIGPKRLEALRTRVRV